MRKSTKFMAALSVCLAVMACTTFAQKIDLTKCTGKISDSLYTYWNFVYNAAASYCGAGQAIDGNATTRYYTRYNRGWIQWEADYPAIVNEYTITENNTSYSFNPKTWDLLGSNDGSTWTTLHQVAADSFVGTMPVTNTYTFDNTTPYKFYRLSIIDNNGQIQFQRIQIYEWQLLCDSIGLNQQDLNNPVSGLTVLPMSDTKMLVGFHDNSQWEDSVLVERSPDGSTWTPMKALGKDTSAMIDSLLTPNTTYYYRVAALSTLDDPGNLPWISGNATTLQGAGTLSNLCLAPTIDTIECNQLDNAPGEGLPKLVDGDQTTKFLTFAYQVPTDTHTNIIVSLVEPGVVSRYGLSSANDALERDPASWNLLATNDTAGHMWNVLDTRTNGYFLARYQGQEYTIANTLAYKYYALQIYSVFYLTGANSIQMGEFQLYGATDTTTANQGVGQDFEIDIWLKSGVASQNNQTSIENSNTLFARSYPNPFKYATKIEFNALRAGNAKVDVYNIVGQKVATLLNGNVPAGKNSVTWNSQGISAGIYCVRVQVNGMTKTTKLMLTK